MQFYDKNLKAYFYHYHIDLALSGQGVFAAYVHDKTLSTLHCQTKLT
jgi:hypothetical protein